MSNVWLRNLGVLLHRLWLYIIIVSQNIMMFPGRSESIKWIRKKFSNHASAKSKLMKEKIKEKAKENKKGENTFFKNYNSNNKINDNKSNNNYNKNNNSNNNNVRDLNEILIVSNDFDYNGNTNNNNNNIITISHGVQHSFTPTPIIVDDKGHRYCSKMSNNKYVNEVTTVTDNQKRNAPIAQAELIELDEEHYNHLCSYCCVNDYDNDDDNDNDNDNNVIQSTLKAVRSCINNNKHTNSNVKSTKKTNCNNVSCCWCYAPIKIASSTSKGISTAKLYDAINTWPIGKDNKGKGDVAVDVNVEMDVNSRRSKSSRVRNYWKKCKELLLNVGSNNQWADTKLKCVTIEATTTHTTQTSSTSTSTTTNCFANLLNHSHITTATTTVKVTATTMAMTTTTTTTTATTTTNVNCENLQQSNTINEESEELYDDVADADSYEDIDFGIHSLITATTTAAATTRSKPPLVMSALPSLTTIMHRHKPQEIVLNKSTNCNRENDEDHKNNNESNGINNEQQHLAVAFIQTECAEQKEAAFHALTIEDYNKANNKEISSSKLLSNRISDLEYCVLVTLIDKHIGNVFPILLLSTRTTLIREARDVLYNIYHGYLDNFECLFLGKFAKIAKILQKRHRIGEALLWCQGWPLVTPSGAVILHLGGLAENQIKPADVCLGVKTVSIDKEPQLYAIWRPPSKLTNNIETAVKVKTKKCSSNSTLKSTLSLCELKTESLNSITATIKQRESLALLSKSLMLQCCQLDYQDHTKYLSMWAREMLNEELPQLLQNLLVGVEQSVERLTLNELQLMQPELVTSTTEPISSSSEKITYNTNYSALTSLSSSSLEALQPPIVTTSAIHIGNSRNENVEVNDVVMPTRVHDVLTPSSPKCLLKRSDLITKNKLHSNNSKYLIRRLTNRQDSINSTSSGNSSASGISATSSDGGLYSGNYYYQQQQNSQKLKQQHNDLNNVDCQKATAPTPAPAITITTTITTNIITTSTSPSEPNSPALPRFCLGNTFPHIDSDEDSVHDHCDHLMNHDQINHLNDSDNNCDDHYKMIKNNGRFNIQRNNNDFVDSEILSVNSVADIPEKLLLSGINLPGLHELRGFPLITVDAGSVFSNNLKCSDVATLLLLYINITKSTGNRGLYNNTIDNVSLQRTKQKQPERKQQLEELPITRSNVTAATNFSENPVKSYRYQQQEEAEGKQSSLPLSSPPLTITILIIIENSQHLTVVDLICESLQLLKRYRDVVVSTEIFAAITTNVKSSEAYTESKLANKENLQKTISENERIEMEEVSSPSSISNTAANSTSKIVTGETHKLINNSCNLDHKVKFISIDTAIKNVVPCQLQQEASLDHLKSLCYYDVTKWRDFFIQYEPFYEQCTSVAQRLLIAMNDIRYADLQGLATRRQLYAQHRALSRALMDSELHKLRKRGVATLTHLQQLASNINGLNRTAIIPTTAKIVNNYMINTITSIKNNNNSNSINNIDNNGNNVRDDSSKSRYRPDVTTTIKYPISNVGCYNSTFGSRITSDHSINNNLNSCGWKSNNNSTDGVNRSATVNAINTKTIIPKTTNVSTNLNNNLSINNTLTSTIISLNSSSCLMNTNNNADSNNNSNLFITSKCGINNGIDVAIRLQKVTLLFDEIDRAVNRLEQLTEQRREHLRELTRQKALEDEINEVTAWLNSDGHDTLQRFINLHLSWEMPIKEREQEFEKFYFMSMKHLAKGRDLHIAAKNIKTLQESALNLKTALDCFAEKLEMARERMEATLRLHSLLSSQRRDHSEQMEMERLAEEYAVDGIMDKYQALLQLSANKSLNTNQHWPLNAQKSLPTNSVTTAIDYSFKTPETAHSCHSNYFGSCYETSLNCRERNSSRIEKGDSACNLWHNSRNLDDDIDLIEGDDEETQSKIADSGLGGCHHCDNHSKLTDLCSCSCQSLIETQHLCDKHEALDEECFGPSRKRYLDMHSPLEANKHLQSFTSTLELPQLEELNFLEPKIQKTILLIMREMIGTERDYVRSLYYVIENYVDELLRDDIPQPLRGQRNVIFGNIEKIFEFHNNHFLMELERYENNPLKVGAAFLQMESKFYLYALYNKNKPKSDTLMSEYGTAFFKSKQRELDDKMDLASYLLKPVQRMGKYALLLQQLVKACSTVQGKALQEILADVEELQKAEEMVKFQLRHGNDLLAMDSLRDCDVNVKEQGRLLRQNEFLVWQGRAGKKSLRQVFLFEELVLFSKARRFPDHKNLDIYIYKNSIKTSDIGLTAHIGESLTKFEIWFRKRKPDDTYTLQCMSEDIKNAWTDEISKLLWQQAKRNREIRLAEMSSMGIGSKPCLDIRPSNNQINDRSITINQLTKAPKLRHSFMGLQSEQIKSNRRPNSLISESSLSSGTSTSSLSKSSNASSTNAPYNHHHPIGLELINETQTLLLNNELDAKNSQSYHHHHHHNAGTCNCSDHHSKLSEVGETSTQQTKKYNNHRRSTTVISHLSMESGIISDLCVTPEKEHNDIMNVVDVQNDGHINEFLMNFNNYPNRNESVHAPKTATIATTINTTTKPPILLTSTTTTTTTPIGTANTTAITQSIYQSLLRCHNNNHNNNNNSNNNHN